MKNFSPTIKLLVSMLVVAAMIAASGRSRTRPGMMKTASLKITRVSQSLQWEMNIISFLSVIAHVLLISTLQNGKTIEDTERIFLSAIAQQQDAEKRERRLENNLRGYYMGGSPV
jgi:hypothetical protein